uniref:TITAN-like protein n=1 Tax=Arundo donax TaxID=35708 RepID=A0A0A9CVF8_ARUDO
MPPKPANPLPAAEFEYCELCRRNHDQGRRHRYIPAHRSALAAALSCFRSKLSDLRSALLGASPSQPQPRLWCPFCSTDLADLDRPAACSNAIYHLASDEHMKGVKDFLRKHGGGMNQVDSLRISEDELAKWEKGCQSLSTGAKKGSEVLIGPSLAPLKAMGHITLLVQRVMELPDLEMFITLFHMELLDCLSHLVDRPQHMNKHGMPTTNFFHSTDPEIKGHESTIITNGPNPSISCPVHRCFPFTQKKR